MTGVSGIGLHLRPGAREWFFGWLARTHPDLVEPVPAAVLAGAPTCRSSTGGSCPPGSSGSPPDSVSAPSADQELAGRDNPVRGVPGDRDASFPRGSLPASSSDRHSGEVARAEPVLIPLAAVISAAATGRVAPASGRRSGSEERHRLDPRSLRATGAEQVGRREWTRGTPSAAGPPRCQEPDALSRVSWRSSDTLRSATISTMDACT